MLPVIFIVVVLGIIFGIYFFLKNSITNALNMDLELDPPQVQKGHKVKMTLIFKPEKNLKVESINGTIFCRRYDEYKGSWVDKTEFPVVHTGKTIAKIEFTFAQDILLEAGKEQKFVGKVPLPEEGMITEIRGVIQVHWFVLVKVKVPGQPLAELDEELVVLPPTITDENVARQQLENLYDPMYDVEMSKQRAEEREKEEQEVIKGMKKMPGGLFTAMEDEQQDMRQIRQAIEEEKARKEQELEKEKEMEKPASQLTAKEAREKYKVHYHTPFDPTKQIQQTAQSVSASDYISMVTNQKEEAPTGPRMHAADSDIYKERHLLGGSGAKKDQRIPGKDNVPDQYRTHHHFARSAKDQQIFDKDKIPEEYRSGSTKSKLDFTDEQSK